MNGVDIIYFQGLNIYITVWDRDNETQQNILYDMVDEFNFNFTDAPGAKPLVKVFDGVRNPPKSRYIMYMFALLLFRF